MIDLKNNSVTLEEKKKRKRKAKKKPYSSLSYTTGNIGLNIDRFNKAAGTFSQTSTPDCALGCPEGPIVADGIGGGALTEAKRYVRRYYIRPQNIFCSNKAEILKALIDLDDANCSVYTLNNLGDEKDVSKLMNSDIIYYYDNGILYDKNHVKVMDYDLSIKHEEERKHFANVDKASDKEFKNAYEDRMTDATELEEDFFNGNTLSFTQQEFIRMLTKHGHLELGECGDSCDMSGCFWSWEATLDENTGIVTLTSWGYNVYTEEDGIEGDSYEFDTASEAYDCLVEIASKGDYCDLTLREAFNLDFKDVNVFGEDLHEALEDYCCICGEPIDGYGNNPEPYAHEGRCCDGCNLKFVIPSRLRYGR